MYWFLWITWAISLYFSLWLTWCPGTAFSHSPDSHVLFSLTHLMSMYFFDSPELISMYYFFLLLTWADVHILLSLTHLSWCPYTSFSDSPELMSMYFFLWLTWADVHVLLSLTHLSWCPCISFSDSLELMSMYFFLWLTWADVHILLWLTWADVHVLFCLTHLSWCPCTFLSDSPELGRLQHAVDDLDHHLLQHSIVGTHHGNQGVTHMALLQQLLTGLWISSSPCHSCTTWLCVYMPLKTLQGSGSDVKCK